MTIFIFYKKPPEGFCETPQLYAYTDEKDLKDEFYKQRDMNKFIMRKEKNISKKEFAHFCAQYRDQRLERGQFYTKAKISSGRIKVSVVCTYSEESDVVIKSDRIFDRFSDNMIDAKIFSNKYLDVLNKLLYFKMYGFYKMRPKYDVDDFYEPYYSTYGPPTDFILSELQDGFWYDELQIFLTLFGSTFK